MDVRKNPVGIPRRTVSAAVAKMKQNVMRKILMEE